MFKMRSWIQVAAAGIIAMTSVTAQEGGTSKAEDLLAGPRPLVIAHRGYSALAPENTIPAFEFALKSGADLVELDYHHSADGIPIVLHDYTLDRTTDGDENWGETKVRAEAKKAAELQTLDAGKWFSPGFAGARLPLLTEALDVIQKGGVTLIERKAGDAATCVKMLRERKLINQVVVQAFDWEYLRDFHKQEPAQVLGALGPSANYEGRKLSDAEKALSPKWNDIVKEMGARIVVWNKQVTKEAVSDAHAKGLKVWVYTINDVPLAHSLIAMGVDGIITDNPSLIFKAIARR